MSLSSSLVTQSAVVGGVGWFAATQIMKYTGMADPGTRWSNLALYGTCAPVGASIVIVPRLLGTPPKDALVFTSLATAAALMLDGIATVFAPHLYTTKSNKTPLEALAGIAFGAGVGIFAAAVVTARGTYGF